MLRTISWSEFFAAIFSCIIIYYAAVAVIYFKPEIRKLIKNAPNQDVNGPRE